MRHRACGRICYVGPASTGGRGAVAAWLVVRFSAAVSGVRGGGALWHWWLAGNELNGICS